LRAQLALIADFLRRTNDRRMSCDRGASNRLKARVIARERLRL
jgi:hypothetical protein